MSVLLVFWLWLGLLAGLAVTARGRAALVRMAGDVGRVWGFRRRGEVGRRWHELAAEDAADPALRRAAAVKDAYVAGKFDYDELDWRILLALQPPVPRDRVTASSPLPPVPRDSSPLTKIPWSPTDGRNSWRRVGPGEHCAFRELQSGSGYVGTFCDCGHDMNRHYNGGCNDCDVFLPTEPDPRLVAWGRHG